MNIHFIGISGIGISAIAGYYLKKGNKVSGSSLSKTEVTDNLKKEGAKIFIGHKESNIPKSANLVIYTVAVNKNNPELKEAKKRKIKTITYAEALGDLTRENYTIGISGTHGKSTTTAMLSLIALEAGIDPTIIIGTKMKELGDKNYRVGESNILIIESDEFNASFLNHNPDIIVLNNLEEDHPECYDSINDLIKTFNKYIERIKENGTIIINKDDKNLLKLKTGKKKFFSIRQKDAKELKKILKVPGRYNVYNALAALNAAREMNIDDKTSYKALSKFEGTWRRLDEKKLKDYILVNDYAHHPTALKVTLDAIRERYPKKRICAIFQPHQAQRTYYLFNDFVLALRNRKIDRIVVTDIYLVPGREKKSLISKVNSKMLVDKANRNNLFYLPKEEILNYISENKKDIDVFLLMGAGDIYEISLSLEKEI